MRRLPWREWVLTILGLVLGLSLVVGGIVKGIAWMAILGFFLLGGTVIGIRRALQETRPTPEA